jgi:hypothetical protein
VVCASAIKEAISKAVRSRLESDLRIMAYYVLKSVDLISDFAMNEFALSFILMMDW